MPGTILIALCGGAISALLYASTLTGTLGALLLMLMAQLPLFLVGLSQGIRGAIVASVAGIALVGAIAGLSALGNYAIAEAVPAYLLVQQGTLSRTHPDGTVEWYPVGRLLVWASAYAGLIFLALVLAFALWGAAGGLEGEVKRMFSAMRDALGWGAAPPATERMLEAFAAILPGLGACSWLLITAVNATLAQGLLIRFGRNLRPNPALSAFDLPRWLVAAVVAAALAGIALPGTLGFVGENLCLILVMPYFFSGLALLHAFFRRSGAKTGSFLLFYALLSLMTIIMSWIVVFGIAVLGLIDQLAGLRQRLMRPEQGPDGN